MFASSGAGIVTSAYSAAAGMLSVWEKHTGRNHTLSSLEEKIQDRAQGRYSRPDGKTGVLDFNSLVFARATAEALTGEKTALRQRLHGLEEAC